MQPIGNKQTVFQSIASALRGWAHALRERSFLLLLLAGLIALILLAIIHISGPGWVISIILIAVTLAAELFNTAIEELADALIKEHHPGIAKVKELTAGAVLGLALTTLVVISWLLWTVIHTRFL